MYEILTHSPLFKNIEIDDFLAQVHYQIRTYYKGDMIAQMGEPCTTLMLITKGSVKGEILDASGKSVTIDEMEAPKPLAPIFLFGDKNTFPVNATASTDVELLCIAKDSVLQVFHTNRTFLENYLNLIANITHLLAGKIKFMSFKTIKGKIAHLLLSSPEVNGKITLQQPQHTIAELFGVTRPALARAMGEMEKDGIIQINRREITIVDRVFLRTLN